MSTARNTFKYHFKVGRKIVHTGITTDISRRECEHQKSGKHGWKKGHIFQVGYRTTREAAKKWENEMRRKGYPTEAPRRSARGTYKYHFRVGRKIVRTGITNDISRREDEHRRSRKHGWKKGKIIQVGYRTTYEEAVAWEKEMRAKGYPTEVEYA